MRAKKIDLGYITLIGLLILAGTFSLNLFFRERVSHDRVNISAFPYKIGEWKGEDLKMEEYVYQILQTRNLISRRYTNGTGDYVYLFIVYSETNRSVFHPPEVCMLGSGIKITDKQAEMIGSGKCAFSANKLFSEKDNLKDMTLYCYRAGSLYTGNFYLQQAHLALHQIFSRQVPGATIRVSVPMKNSEEATLATAKSFLSETIKTLDSIT